MAYRSEAVGSLLRPRYLLEARHQFEAGQLGAPDFKALEDRAVNDAIAFQEGVGLDAITDGEMRRTGFIGQFFEALEGFAAQGGFTTHWKDDQGEQLESSRPVIVEKLKWRHSMCAEEWVYLRSQKKLPGKITLLSAQQAASYYDGQKSKAAYQSMESYLTDVVDFTRQEVAELVRLGCTYIQFDAPQYAALIDPQMREIYRQHGNDPDKTIDLCIEMDNAIISGFEGVTFAIHLCRGNNQSKYEASGDYEPISRIFSKARFHRFFLEYDDERSGGFEPLRHIPEGRFVVLGLVSTKKSSLENPDELKRRIEEASKYVPLEFLALSPQCGFASVMTGNLITPEDQKKKLELVTQVAREVWGGN
jgi:5-methyltetrahydropteroyltriglutamate--homocysteine methyltransferase